MQRYRSGHNGADSKSVCEQSHEGSNPSLCAKIKNHPNGWFFVLLYGVPENEERILGAFRRDSKGEGGRVGDSFAPPQGSRRSAEEVQSTVCSREVCVESRPTNINFNPSQLYNQLANPEFADVDIKCN